MRCARLGIVVPLLVSSSLAAQERRVKIEEDEAVRDLASFAATYDGVEQWSVRAATIRGHVMTTLGLDPLPRRTPLEPIIRHRREHDGYSVENVAFESVPGFYVTGNLYRPLDRPPPYAGVLCPHGHFQPGEHTPGSRFRADMQRRCATLARMGAVVFAYDMVGWGESTQTGHDDSDSLILQTLNGIRCVDFITAVHGVDAGRVGVTGASGGGSQSFLLAAVDDRVAVSVPVVMVSAHFFGGCKCESGLPIHEGPTHKTNNAEIAALAAPRPQLLISCGQDWTKNTPTVELPYIRRVYELFDAADSIENVHLADEGHDYGATKRAPMYRFMARHLGLDLAAVTNLDGSIDETPVVIEPRVALHVFDDARPRPADALPDRESIMSRIRELQTN